MWQCHRFFIHAEAHNGDADGPTNLDLFVDTTSATTAKDMWRTYFKGWDLPKEVRVWQLPDQVGMTVIDWSKLPSCLLKV